MMSTVDRGATRHTDLVEEGAAFARLADFASAGPRPREPRPAPERFDVVIIGAGQAGLATGYHLARRGISFVILDTNRRVGDSWRQRWDSLRLFTPARFDRLDGMRFPAPRNAFPTKDEMADYLEAYSARFALPVRTGVRVDRLWREGSRYMLAAGDRRFEADHVVVAMSSFQDRRLPEFSVELDPSIVQIHSSDYRNPAQLREGGVLIVGAGNSGAEIAVEVARTHRILMAGRDTGHVPFRLEGFAGRHVLAPLVIGFVFHHVLTTRTPLGRKVRPAVIGKGGPLIRIKPQDIAAAGIERVPRVVGVRAGRPLLGDGRAPDVANVVWCSGFRNRFAWMDLPVEGGEPAHSRGIVASDPGLYFVGLHFLYAFSSTMIRGVSRDARHIATP